VWTVAKTDPRVDAYIAKSAVFAQPILIHLRDLMHRCIPEIEEAIKWGMPFFVLGGESIANMAAFKTHASFGFWRHKDVTGLEERGGAMGSLGKLSTLSDLPGDAELGAFINKAAALARSGVKVKRGTGAPKTELPMPDDLALAMKAAKDALVKWDTFSPSHRREYIEWVIEAKREETRAKRIVQTVELVAEGKDRNWKYRDC
jgi:uncharacterized protein YdeI (YjbR/CyaY-like superfamily)